MCGSNIINAIYSVKNVSIYSVILEIKQVTLIDHGIYLVIYSDTLIDFLHSESFVVYNDILLNSNLTHPL